MSKFLESIKKAVEHLQNEEKALAVSDRKDEANIVKIKINIYNICSTVYQVFESRGNDCSKVYIAKLDDFTKNWETSLAKAREHEDVEQALIEEIKLETLEKIKKSYYNYCK